MERIKFIAQEIHPDVQVWENEDGSVSVKLSKEIVLPMEYRENHSDEQISEFLKAEMLPEGGST